MKLFTKTESVANKLKHIAITAEELLADLRGRDGGSIRVVEQSDVIDYLLKELSAVTAERDALRSELADVTDGNNFADWLLDKYQDAVGNLFCYGRPYDRFMKPGRTITECLPLFAAEFEEVKAERDALQSRIDAGVVVYGRECTTPECFVWGPLQLDKDTHAARIIDCQLIAQDERKGDRRKEQTRCNSEFQCLRDGKWEHMSRNKLGKNDRRRKDGTRADRGVGK